MRDLIAARDWSATTLGPHEAWPPCLESALGLILSSPMPMALMWGKDGVLLYNDAYSRMAGDRHPAILGAKIRQAWPETAEFNEHVIEEVLAGRALDYRDQEFRLNRRGSAEPAWFDVAYSPVSDEAGRPAGVLVIAVETTDRVLAERRRSQSELLFRTLAETMPALMILADAGGGCVYANPQIEAYSGRGTDGLLEDGWLQIAHPEDLEAVVATRDRLVGEQIPYSSDYRLRRFDGAYRWHALRAAPVRDAEGHVIQWVVLATDIHEQKLTEADLRRRALRLEGEIEKGTRERNRLFELSNDMITVAGMDGYFKSINPACSRLLGFTEEELLSRPFVEFVHPDDLRRTLEVMGGLGAGQAVEHFENRYVRADGGVVWISWRAVPEGEQVYAVGRDVTRERHHEEMLRQAQKMEAIGQLTGGIAHDFNNVLGAVIGSLDFIRRKPDDLARVERFAQAGLQAAERGAKLTSQLLAFSRAQRIEMKPVDVAVLIGGMQELLARTLGPLVRLRIHVQEHGNLVLSDPTQLETAVLNLAINARDAMPDGGELTIATRPRHVAGSPVLEPGDYIELSVSDTGIGMTPEVAARAFDPFFTTKGPGKGTGLGLSQAYGIARQSGGTAEIESRPAGGTTVRLLLRRTEAPPAAAPGPEPEPPDQPSDRAAILVVDDDPDVRRVLVDGIGALGYEVREAADAQSALAALDQGAPDLMIADYAMPGVTGAQLAEMARKRFPNLPIAFVTGYADTAAIERAVGPDAVILRKPFRVGEIQATIRDALKPC